MEITSALVYSLRFAEKDVLSELIQGNISKLRKTPVIYRPFRQVKHRVFRKAESDENWRETTIREIHRRIRETADPNYDEILGIFNKVSASTVAVLSKQAIDILKTQNEQFRLRVTTLLFDKAIKGSAYASVMADVAVELSKEFPEIKDDLSIQIKMFGTLYDMSETLMFPSSSDPDFANLVIAWSKQKDIRRGYSRFLTHIYIRNLISGEDIHSSMNKVLNDLESSVVQPKTEKMEEIITQYADFLFEIGKLLPKEAVELRGLIETRVGSILAKPRLDLPVLNMRSRFKLEDTQKCVRAS